MSRIGKLPIKIPESVKINYNESEIVVEGKFGKLEMELPNTIKLNLTENDLSINLVNNTKSLRALHGLYRTLINNMVIGVSEQFELTLLLKGIGYRGSVKGSELTLNLGYSHPVNIVIPEQISVEIIQNTTINIKSCNKEMLGLFAANIRSWRKPEPYKGKGILYKNEQIIRKAGKSGK